MSLSVGMDFPNVMTTAGNRSGISFCAEPYNCGNGSFLWRYCLFSTVIRGIRILPMPIWVITRFGPTCCLCLLLRPMALPTDLSLPGRGGISAWHFCCMLFTHYSCGNHRTRFYGVLSSLGLDNCFFAFRYNSIGWLPVFCVGILLSRHPVYISWRWISFGVVLFVLSLFNRYLWVVSPILALFPVAAVLPLARKEPLQNVLLFMGKLSAALFVTHAFVRQQVLAHDQALPPEISGLLYLLLCIVVAWVYRLCLTCFYKKIHL